MSETVRHTIIYLLYNGQNFISDLKGGYKRPYNAVN